MTDMTPEEAVLESFKADLERGIGKYLIEDEAGLLSAILSLETGLAAASKRIAELEEEYAALKERPRTEAEFQGITFPPLPPLWATKKKKDTSD
jgi:hypothetical protein